MRTAFVTGASGFIGSYVVKALLAAGWTVNGLVRDPTRAWRLRSLDDSRLNVAVGDILDVESLNQWLKNSRGTTVIHAAGEGVGRPASQTTVERVNVIGTANLLAALEHTDPRVVVVLGSANEYAPSKNRLTENSSLAPVDWYGSTKLRSYAACSARAIEDLLPLVYLRMFYVYGPGEQSQRPLAYAIASVRGGEAPTFTSGRQVRDFVYVSDVADLVVRAANSSLEPGTVINVGAGRGLRLREVIEPTLELLNHEASPKTWSRPYRDTEIWYQVADPSRAKTMLGWEATTPIAVGLQNCIIG